MITWTWVCGVLIDPMGIGFRCPERLVIFTFGLVFCKGLMRFVLQNLMTFLTDSLNLKLNVAVAIVNLHDGLRNVLQVFVSLFIDACLGYRWALIVSSVLYSAGFFLLALSVPGGEKCRLKDCFKKLKRTSFWEGLALVILGGAAQVIPLDSLSIDQIGVVKAPEDCEPTRVPVGCLKFEVNIGGWRRFQQKVIRWFYYGFFLLGAIASFFGVFFFVDWKQLFLALAIAIFIGLLWFLCGFPFYGPHRLQPSLLLTAIRTVIAALQKRHLNYRDNLDRVHPGDGEAQNQLTDHLKLLNNAAVKEPLADEMGKHKWRLCTVQEVEQTKLLIDIIPMSATFVVYGMVKSLGVTFFTEQANSMNSVPIVIFQLSQWISEYGVNKGYEMVLERRIQRTKKRYSDGVKIGLGMLASIICCAVASFVESKRLKALRGNGLLSDPKAVSPISGAWLALQFFFLSAMEGLAGGGIADFFGHYMPESRRYAPIFTRTLTGFGTILNIGFIAILDYYSKLRYKESWLGDSLNQSRLDLIYRAYVILALLNCFVYAYVSSSFSFDNIIEKSEEEEETPHVEIVFL